MILRQKFCNKVDAFKQADLECWRDAVLFCCQIGRFHNTTRCAGTVQDCKHGTEHAKDSEKDCEYEFLYSIHPSSAAHFKVCRAASFQQKGG